MILKKYRKLSLIVLFIAAFLFFFLGILSANKVEAACSIDCIGNTTGSATGQPVRCEYDVDTWFTDNKICTVGNVTNIPTALFSTVNPCFNSDTNALPSPNTHACRHDACPTFNYQNGDSCSIIAASGALCGTITIVTGTWNASQSRCIKCSGKKEGSASSLCGDAAGYYVDFSTSQCTGNGDTEFETACDNTVSVQCDDKLEGCAGTAGFCDANGSWTSCPFNNCSAGACLAVTATPTATGTPTATPTGTVCPPLAPGDSCVNPGAKAENRYDPFTGSCRPFPVPCPLAHFCENGVCKEPRTLFAMLFDGASFLLSIVISLAILIILIGGFRYTMSGGDHNNVESGKKIIYYGLLGLIIAGLSYAIVSVIYNLLKS